MTLPAAVYSISQQFFAMVLSRALRSPSTSLLQTPVGTSRQALDGYLAALERTHPARLSGSLPGPAPTRVPRTSPPLVPTSAA